MLIKRRKIIIGIHGLSNKPPGKLLAKWWIKSIRDGLRLYHGYKKPFHFTMVYWADVTYAAPQDPAVKDENHPRFLDEPYVPVQSPQKPSRGSVGKRLFDKFEHVIDGLLLNKSNFLRVNYMTDQLLKRNYRDLDIYYRQDWGAGSADGKSRENLAREAIRRRLKKALIRHKKKKIMLIAHSMGSIIAHDVLYELKGKVNIDVFATIGSPLGFPMVISKFFDEHKIPYNAETKRQTPAGIKAWYNFADIDDGIAANDDLSNEFNPNEHGVKPVDKNIYNDYKNWKTENAHKSFGYLRTPEMAELIHAFLGRRQD